jgi:pimeloyl-ACP methyl ester carboxylesterase
MNPSRSGVVDSLLESAGGLRLAVRVQSDGDPLLLINGMTRSLDSWEPFVSELAGRRIVSFDAPGVGASPTPVLPLPIPVVAALAAEVLDSLGVERSSVVGFSHGGAVAQQFALDFPDRVRRLVLVSTSCGVGASPGLVGDTLRSLAAAGDLPPTGDGTLGMFWQALAFSTWSSIPFLADISVPTLVVCGAQDRIVPADNSRLLARRIPNASLEIIPGGHDLQRADRAKRLALSVEEFLGHPAQP